jgi:hypothetical protein
VNKATSRIVRTLAYDPMVKLFEPGLHAEFRYWEPADRAKAQRGDGGVYSYGEMFLH